VSSTKTDTVEDIEEHVNVKGEARATCCTAAFCGGSVILRQGTRRRWVPNPYEYRTKNSKNYEETDI
jgi:hypothetical protein